jgi:hypothetical protein
VSFFLLWREIVFDVTYILRLQYKIECRNRYSNGMEDGQMTPRGFPDLNSYINGNRYALFFGGLGNPQGILTNNNQQKHAGATEDEKERRCNWGQNSGEVYSIQG